MSWQPPPAPPGGPGYPPYPGGQRGPAGNPWGPAPGLLYASFWRRFLGYLLDWVLLSVVPSVIVFFVVAGTAFSHWLTEVGKTKSGATLPTLTLPNDYYLVAAVVSALIGIFYWGVLVSAWGRTVGEAAAGVRVVRQEDPSQLLPLERALSRAVVWWGPALLGLYPPLVYVGALFWLISLLWVAWDPRKQGLHDKIGRALVVRAVPAAMPYGAPPPGYVPPPPPPGWGS